MTCIKIGLMCRLKQIVCWAETAQAKRVMLKRRTTLTVTRNMARTRRSMTNLKLTKRSTRKALAQKSRTSFIGARNEVLVNSSKCFRCSCQSKRVSLGTLCFHLYFQEAGIQSLRPVMKMSILKLSYDFPPTMQHV